MSVLLVEQSVRLATAFADRLHVMSRGRLTEVTAHGGRFDEDAVQAAYFGGTPHPRAGAS